MEIMLSLDYQAKVVYGANGPQPQVLAEDEKLKVILAGLEPGQKIPSHPEALAVYQILEGSGWFTVNEERYPVKEGATIITPDGASRGVEATTRLVFLATRINP